MSKQDLIKARNKLNEKHTFEPGQIVEWKAGLNNRRPAGPFIVMEDLEDPIRDATEETGSCYFREPLDILVGCFSENNDFIVFHFDSRRLQPAD